VKDEWEERVDAHSASPSQSANYGAHSSCSLQRPASHGVCPPAQRCGVGGWRDVTNIFLQGQAEVNDHQSLPSDPNWLLNFHCCNFKGRDCPSGQTRAVPGIYSGVSADLFLKCTFSLALTGDMQR